MTTTPIEDLHLDSAHGERIACSVVRRPPAAPPGRCGVFWLSGFKSTMTGTKASAVAVWAQQAGRECVRFDYSGHGASTGRFEDGTIGRWLGEALAVFEEAATGPQIVVGSSMGGWIALLLMREHLRRTAMEARRIRGLVLIAPAVDMTETLILPSLDEERRREIAERGMTLRPSAYDDGPYPITRGLIEEGRRHLILDAGLELPCPVRILHGLEDPDVPWRHSVLLAGAVACDDLTVTLVKDGDHRLSGGRDIARLLAVIDGLAREVDG